MTVYASSGPGVQANDAPDGALAMPFERCHIAECVSLPIEFDQLSGPQELQDGVRVTWGENPRTLEKLPKRVQFDADKFTADEAKSWLSSHNVSSYQFLPCADEKTPQSRGAVDNPDEQPPPGYASLQEFYAQTESTRSAPPTVADVARAGQELYDSFRLNAVCDSIQRHSRR